MAGKLHRDFEHYARAQDGHELAPGDKRARAYAEGYVACRDGLGREVNPHPESDDDESGYQSWLYGFQDAERGEPATHVGRPDAVAPEPEPDPDEMLAAIEAARTHAELDAIGARENLILPADWERWMVAEKRNWLHALYSAG